MSRPPDRPLGGHLELVRLAPAGGEAFIQEVRHERLHVEVDLLLADGSDAVVRLQAADWDWLEAGVGDIVPVRRVPARDLSV